MIKHSIFEPKVRHFHNFHIKSRLLEKDDCYGNVYRVFLHHSEADASNLSSKFSSNFEAKPSKSLLFFQQHNSHEKVNLYR